MSIKIETTNVNTIVYNTEDVKKVVLDGTTVWCKPFSYTTGTLPTGVASLTCTRYSTQEPTASTGTISSGGTVYYDDSIYWTATASTGYTVTVTHGSSNKLTVTSNINGVSDSGVSATLKTYTITWKYLSAYPNTWTTTTTTVRYGEIPVPPLTPSDVQGTGDYVNYRQHWNSSEGDSGWDDLSAIYANRTIQALYQKQGYVSISVSYCTANLSSGWYREARSFSVMFTANSGYSFNGEEAQDTKSIIRACPGTFNVSPTYAYVTVNCISGLSTITVNDNTVSSGWQGFAERNTSITWTANTGYGYQGKIGQVATSISQTVTTAKTYADSDIYYVSIAATGSYVGSVTIQKARTNTQGIETWTTASPAISGTSWYLYGIKYRAYIVAETNYRFTKSSNTTYEPSLRGSTNTLDAHVSAMYMRIVVGSLTRCGAKFYSTTLAEGDNWISIMLGSIVVTPGMGYAFDSSGTVQITVAKPAAGESIGSYSANYVEVTFSDGNYHQWNSTSTLYVDYNSSIGGSGDNYVFTQNGSTVTRTVSLKSTAPAYYFYYYDVTPDSGNITSQTNCYITSTQEEPSTNPRIKIQGNWLALNNCLDYHVGNYFGSSSFNVSNTQYTSTQSVMANSTLKAYVSASTNTASSEPNYGLFFQPESGVYDTSYFSFKNPAITGLCPYWYNVYIRYADNDALITSWEVNSSHTMSNPVSITFTREHAYRGIKIEITIAYSVEFANIEFNLDWYSLDPYSPYPTPDWTNYTPSMHYACGGGYYYTWDYIPLYIKFRSTGYGFEVYNPYTGQISELENSDYYYVGYLSVYKDTQGPSVKHNISGSWTSLYDLFGQDNTKSGSCYYMLSDQS